MASWNKKDGIIYTILDKKGSIFLNFLKLNCEIEVDKVKLKVKN